MVKNYAPVQVSEYPNPLNAMILGLGTKLAKGDAAMNLKQVILGMVLAGAVVCGSFAADSTNAPPIKPSTNSAAKPTLHQKRKAAKKKKSAKPADGATAKKKKTPSTTAPAPEEKPADIK